MSARVLAQRARRQASYWAYPLRAWLQPRRFHAYCVSAPRSGTHSVAGLFARYRAAHEPDSHLVFEALRSRASGTLTERAVRSWLEWRDRALWLEMEAHNLLNNVPGLLANTFPDAKFVLVIRDCYSWLESYTNYHLATLPRWEASYAKSVRDWQLGALGYSHGAGDRVLAQRGLYPLDAYLAFWAACNQRVLTEVPVDRLLVLRLDELDLRLRELAQFVGVPVETLDRSRAHLDAQTAKRGIVGQIDRAYLAARVQAHCGELMARYFPEISTAGDVLAVSAGPRG